MFAFAADMTFVESAGVGGTINRVTSTITTESTSQGITISLGISTATDVAIAVAPSGSATYAHAGEFGMSSGVDSVTWSLSVSGVDANGRAFSATSPTIPIQLRF